MKTKLKRLAVLGFTIGLLFEFPGYLVAQGTLEALSFTPPGVASYTTNGVGWSFVPTSDLSVTAVFSTAPQVSFWQGSSQVIATYTYTGPYGSIPTGPSTNFQAVQSLLLSAGQTYFISAQSSDFMSPVNFFGFGLNGAGGLEPFTTSSYISQFASYYVSPGGQWSSPTTPASENVNYWLLGPNFQFQVVPEPSVFGLFALGSLLLGWRFFSKQR